MSGKHHEKRNAAELAKNSQPAEVYARAAAVLENYKQQQPIGAPELRALERAQKLLNEYVNDPQVKTPQLMEAKLLGHHGHDVHVMPVTPEGRTNHALSEALKKTRDVSDPAKQRDAAGAIGALAHNPEISKTLRELASSYERAAGQIAAGYQENVQENHSAKPVGDRSGGRSGRH